MVCFLLIEKGEFWAQGTILPPNAAVEKGGIQNLYKGILQIGVGIYHGRRSNLRGALRLISSGMELTRRFGPFCLGIDVELFLQISDQFKELKFRTPFQVAVDK